MNDKLTNFIYQSYNIEVIVLDNEVYFNAKQVGECLEISSTTVRDHISKMTNRQKLKITNKMIQNSGVDSTNIRKLNNAGEIFLTEAGVYKLVFKSRKPEAERFTDWIAEEVLPSIRKNGYYSINNNEERKKELAYKLLTGGIDSVEAHKQLLEIETKPLVDKIEEQKPKVEYHDNVLNSDKLLNISDIAKDLGMSGRELNKTLHDLKVQFTRSKVWYLYKDYQDMIPKYCDYKMTEFGQQLKWTEQGRKWIINLLKKNSLI